MTKQFEKYGRISVGQSRVFLDRCVLSANIKAVTRSLDSKGLGLRAVVKGGFQRNEILSTIEAEGITSIAVSDLGMLNSFSGSVLKLYPSAPPKLATPDRSQIVTEVSLETIRQYVNRKTGNKHPLNLDIPVLTHERREGLEIAEIPGFIEKGIREFGSHVNIRSLQANFGCVQSTLPNDTFLAEIFETFRVLKRRFGGAAPSSVSLGGSQLLAGLDSIQFYSDINTEFRIGETILAGTIPNAGPLKGCLPVFSVDTTVLQKRTRGPNCDFVLDIGSTHISKQSLTRHFPKAEILSVSSEICVFSCQTDMAPKQFQKFTLPLSYNDCLRSLPNL
ncbi:MAG: hypothetical protein GQ535_17455 [Rhodobacteraceae bacterium]|nr:hypothetical protein [Paracoccaceae bacterium]